MIKVIRLLVYEGDKEWIEETLRNSHISPESPLKSSRGNISETWREIFTQEMFDMEEGKEEEENGSSNESNVD